MYSSPSGNKFRSQEERNLFAIDHWFSVVSGTTLSESMAEEEDTNWDTNQGIDWNPINKYCKDTTRVLEAEGSPFPSVHGTYALRDSLMANLASNMAKYPTEVSSITAVYNEIAISNLFKTPEPITNIEIVRFDENGLVEEIVMFWSNLEVLNRVARCL